jgi:hypothetical protein
MQRFALAPCNNFRGVPLSEPSNLVSIKNVLARAYLKLLSMPFNQNNSRMVLLARHGDYEVRLFELSHHRVDGIPSLWIEVYDTTREVTVDSSGCGEIGAAALAADGLVAQAKVLAEEGEAST